MSFLCDMLYVAEVGARVDTVSFRVEQSRRASGGSQCDLYHEPDTRTTYRNFIERKAVWVNVARWLPAGSSWQRISDLADSLTTHH